MTAALLGEFVQGLSEAEFRSDVQLSSFRRPENLDLVKSYIFTGKAVEGKKSSAELLRLLAEAYMPGNVPNRFTFIANYGHGKSHFALMLANYFGKPLDSPEVDTILDKLEHTLVDRAEYGFFRGFKSNHRRPFLVLTLRGDEPGDLRSKFFRALEEARRGYPELESEPLPFWFAGAEHFLENIPQEFHAKAEAFLRTRNLQLSLLAERVRKRDARTQAICRDLHFALYNAYPDFGADASIRDAIAWAADNLCGPDKPVDSLLVVFDEFGAFVRDYSLGELRGPGAPLQDLLNGIENRRGKAAFVALTQQDPDATARNALKGGLLGDADSLLKELNRLPDSERYVLHSSLELVLDAYLKQSPGFWDELMRERAFSEAVSEATEAAFGAFKERYREELGWDFGHFRQVVTKGCFPLHPLTTALLSTLQLRSTAAAPRTVLGFVVRSIADRSAEPVLRNDRPNWVWPVALVDYFQDNLDEEPYKQFLEALQMAGGADAPAEQVTVLKAMLLQIAGRVETQRTGYETTIAQLSGLPKQVAGQTIKDLSDSGVIRPDASKRFYTFWPVGGTAHRVEELLRERLRDRVLDRRALDKVNGLLKEAGWLQPVPVNGPWGHAEDWHASQVLVGFSDFGRDALIKLAAEHLQWRLDGKQKARGLVAWLLAENSEQVEAYREGVAGLLDEAFGDSYVPLIAVRPRVPSPELTRSMLELYWLSRFDNTDIRDVGKDQYEDRWRRTLEQLTDLLKELFRTGDYEVPRVLRGAARVTRQALPPVLFEIFRVAYHQGPKDFFDQFKLNQVKLRTSVAKVGSHLSDNTLDAPKAFEGDPVAHKVVDLYLRTKWRIANADLRVQEPFEGSPLHPGWSALDDYFRAGAQGRPAKEILTKLLNPPYGYDYNTLTLLFDAWYGYNRHDLQLSHRGRLVAISEVSEDQKKGLKPPKDYLGSLADCAITRRDRSQLTREAEDLVRRVDSETFDEPDAHNALRKLRNFLHDDRSDPNLKGDVESAAKTLELALERASEYDRKAESLRRRVEKRNEIDELVETAADIRRLPNTTRVRANEPGPDELLRLISNKVEVLTEGRCARFERLANIADYGLHRTELRNDRQVLSKMGAGRLVERVDRALKALEQQKADLEMEHNDAAALEVLEAVSTKGDLSSLRQNYRRVAELEVHSTQAQELAESKINAIGSEIARLQAFARALPERLDNATRLGEVRSLHEEILRLGDSFEGTDEQEGVEHAMERCRILEDYFAELDKARASRLETPEDASELLQDLGGLKAQYRATLSSTQVAVLRQVEESSRQEAARRAQQALVWLESCEEDVARLNGGSQHSGNGSNLGELLKRLEDPPAFLPYDAQGRLVSCEREVRQLADQDKVWQVERHFRQIADRQRQLECLERLRQLVEEPE